MRQQALIKDDLDLVDKKNWGTFKDSLNAPVHRWFTYPAGFSYKAVEASFEKYGITKGMTVYDPFAGTATTNLVAKGLGIHSFGVEAHPFVVDIARTKIFWEYDFDLLDREINSLVLKAREQVEATDLDAFDLSDVPELVTKCYSSFNLAQLCIIKDLVFRVKDRRIKSLFKLAVTNLLRSAAEVHTGWPYIAPKKGKNGAGTRKDVVSLLEKQLKLMRNDVDSIKNGAAVDGDGVKTEILFGSSQNTFESDGKPVIPNESVDHLFTSPPYLNNFDYADRTRLELYFWEEAKTWSDITRNVRDKLMMSATTQIKRSEYNPEAYVDEKIKNVDPILYSELTESVNKLSALRNTKGGKKSYDILVAGYFNDIYDVLLEAYRVLKPGAYSLWILGDSAPYGVHIPTDEYIGRLGKSIGFSSYEIDVLRERGGKWKANPQRHTVALRESIVVLKK